MGEAYTEWAVIEDRNPENNPGSFNKDLWRELFVGSETLAREFYDSYDPLKREYRLLLEERYIKTTRLIHADKSGNINGGVLPEEIEARLTIPPGGP